MADSTAAQGQAATGASATAGQTLTIPEDVKKKYPQLLELIQASESMNAEERQYWINILPIMSPEQITNLFEILDNERKQLAAIDTKYQQEMQKLGSAQSVQQMEEDRRKRRTERKSSEAAHTEQETAAAEDLLKQIEDAAK
jgi:hypothetical protein